MSYFRPVGNSSAASTSSFWGNLFPTAVPTPQNRVQREPVQKPEPELKLAGKTYPLSKLNLIDHVQLSRLALVKLELPESMRSLSLPLHIAGRLELSQAGTRPLTLCSDLIARKGVYLNLSNLDFTVGTDSDPPIKIQAADGKLDIRAKSLDLLKAQLFSSAAMYLESAEKPIRLGRHVESQMVIHEVIDCWYGAGLISAVLHPNQIPTCPHDPPIVQASDAAHVDVAYPYKRPNGSFLMTEGALTIVAPYGVKINQADINVRGGDWTVHSNTVVQNEGGKIFVNGNANLLGVTLKNTLLSAAQVFNGENCTLLLPLTQRAEITVNGNFIVETVENFGSFLYVGGVLVEKCVGAKQDFSYVFKVQYGGEHVRILTSPFITPEYRSIVSFGKGAVFPEAKNPQLEGVIQGCSLEMSYEGQAEIGQYQNYRRSTAIKAFKQAQHFNLDRASALFIPNDNKKSPWMHQPSVPLTWNIQLPPAVAMGKNGPYLLGADDKFLYHPLQEIEGLPVVLSEQLQRGYLDAQNLQAQATYIKGRYAAYDYFMKQQGQKPAPEHPQNALITLPDSIDFMVVYSPVAAEDGATAYSPVSLLSNRFDKPELRNPDGGVFVDHLHLTGSAGSSLRILSTLHGEKSLSLTGPHIAVERQSATWLTYHYNETIKRSFWRDSHSSDLVVVTNTESQKGTGRLTTGPQGKAQIKSELFEIKNGAEVHIGTEGADIAIDTLALENGVNTGVGFTESRAGRNSATRYFPVHSLEPASIISAGGITGELGKLVLKSSNLVATDKNIDLKVARQASLGAQKIQQSLGAVVSKRGGTVTVSEAVTELGLPSSIIALNGHVRLRIAGELTGNAPQFYGKTVDVEAESIDFGIERLGTKVFSKTTGFLGFSYINQSVFETHEHALRPSIITQDGAVFRATGGGARIEAPFISGHFTQIAEGGDSVLDSASLHHHVDLQRRTVSLSNPALDMASSVLHRDFGGVLGTLQAQFPILGSVEQLMKANDAASLAQGTMKTLYQAHSFLSSLKSAGNVQNYFRDRMTRLGIGLQDFESQSDSTTAVVPQVTSQSNVTLISKKDNVRAVGLAGDLTNLTLEAGNDVFIDPPAETGQSSGSSEGLDLSLGFTSSSFSVSVGANSSRSESQYRRYAHQKLSVSGRTRVIAGRDVHFSTPFTTAYSQIEGRRIIAQTLQDQHSETHSFHQGSAGLTFGATGVTPSGSFALGIGEGESLRAEHPTYITSTKGSEIRAREAVILRGASFISHGPGLYVSPRTEATDLTDFSHSETTQLGAEFTGGGSVPGFVEMGFESQTRSSLHRSTISSSYVIKGSAGLANRDAARVFERGAAESSHIWIGAPVVADAKAAFAEMRGGMDVIDRALQPFPEAIYKGPVYKTAVDPVFRADDSEPETENKPRRAIRPKVIKPASAPQDDELSDKQLSDRARDLYLGSLDSDDNQMIQQMTQKLIFDVTQERSKQTAAEQIKARKQQAFPLLSAACDTYDCAVENLGGIEAEYEAIYSDRNRSLWKRGWVFVQKNIVGNYKSGFIKDTNIRIPAEIVMQARVNSEDYSSVINSFLKREPIDQKAWESVVASGDEVGGLILSRKTISKLGKTVVNNRFKDKN